MGQNLAVQTALKAGTTGVFFLNMDSSGNLLVSLAADPEGALATTVANGADVAEGSTTDTPVHVSTAGAASVVALLKGLLGPLNFVSKAVAASQTAAVLGATGAAGDYLDTVVISPAIAACGLVSILDGSTTVYTFPGGGTTALTDCRSFSIPVKAVSSTGAWKITTGASVSVIANGRFT